MRLTAMTCLTAVLVVCGARTAPAQSVNLALNRPASASSSEAASYAPAAAVDNDTATRWSSAFTNSEWWAVDLGSTYSVSKVVIYWEAAYAASYDLQVSTDGTTWVTYYSGTSKFPLNGQGTSAAVTPPGVSAVGRYVRVVGKQRATVWGSQYGYSFWECQVYGTAVPSTTSPGAAMSPQPASGATGVAMTTGLSWTPGSSATSYDVALGTTNPPPVVSTAQTGTMYQPGLALDAGTQYYWRVDATNSDGTTTGTVWTFTTVAVTTTSSTPGPATNPAPAPGATNIAATTALSWTPGTAATSYDVALGTSNPPGVVSAGQTTAAYQPASPLAAATTYYWRVDATNESGTTAGTIWTFTTASAAPAVPSGPLPADQSANALVTVALNWAASGNASSYDVAFGSANPPPVVSTGQAATSYQPPAALAYSTKYYWNVVANGAGGTTSGPVWSFTTAAAPADTTASGDTASTANTVLKRLRVFDWNVALGYNPETNVNDYNLQLDLIAALNPDVVTLQEMSYSDADMLTIFLNGLTSRTGRTWTGFYQRANADTTPTANNTGSAILTWLPVDSRSQTLITDVAGFPFGALQIQVTVNSTPVHIATTHLYAWDVGVRAGQIRALQTWLSALGPHRVVAGDYNAYPQETTTWNAGWTSEYLDAWITATGWVQPTNDGGYTFDRRSATGNPERIDYAWVKGMTVSEMSVVKTRRSDHHALMIDFKAP